MAIMQGENHTLKSQDYQMADFGAEINSKCWTPEANAPVSPSAEQKHVAVTLKNIFVIFLLQSMTFCFAALFKTEWERLRLEDGTFLCQPISNLVAIAIPVHAHCEPLTCVMAKIYYIVL